MIIVSSLSIVTRLELLDAISLRERMPGTITRPCRQRMALQVLARRTNASNDKLNRRVPVPTRAKRHSTPQDKQLQPHRPLQPILSIARPRSTQRARPIRPVVEIVPEPTARPARPSQRPRKLHKGHLACNRQQQALDGSTVGILIHTQGRGREGPMVGILIHGVRSNSGGSKAVTGHVVRGRKSGE
jgi:hypothetical protein